MVKLSDIYNQIGEFLKDDEDLEVESIATYSGISKYEYAIRLKSNDEEEKIIKIRRN